MRRAGAEDLIAHEGTDPDQPTKTPKSSSAPTAPSPTSAKTSPITSGSSACSAKTSATQQFLSTPTHDVLDLHRRPQRARPPHLRPRRRTSTTSSTPASPTRRPTSSQALRGMGYTEAGRPLHPLLLRDGRAHAALRHRPRLHHQRRRPEKVLHRSQRPQRLRRQSRRPHRHAHRRHARSEVDTRHPTSPNTERANHRRNRSPSAPCATSCSSYTRNSVIAFDFKDALSFEGETGPYVQYAVVRAATSSARPTPPPKPLSRQSKPST